MTTFFNNAVRKVNVYQNKQAGFTLIELVTVIIIIGVLAVGMSSFLQFGSQIYQESTSRDQLISSARFALERLNREVRSALPNSANVNGACLEFTPIATSSIYTDIPVAPDPASSTISVVRFDQSLFSDEQKVAVYPLNYNDSLMGNGKVYQIATNGLNAAGDVWEITLDETDGDNPPFHFAAHSPTRRIFFIELPLKYCREGTELVRYVNDNNRTVMAENISTVEFKAIPATLTRNGIVQIRLEFNNYNEVITFNNEIQVPNVP